MNGGERKMRTCLHPERSADAEHSHEEHEGAESAWSVTVPWIADGTDNDNQDSGSKELGKLKVSDIGRREARIIPPLRTTPTPESCTAASKNPDSENRSATS